MTTPELWTPPETWLRPGAAARYAGVRTPTLVDWVTRYGLECRRTTGGQREYRQASIDTVLEATGRGVRP